MPLGDAEGTSPAGHRCAGRLERAYRPVAAHRPDCQSPTSTPRGTGPTSDPPTATATWRRSRRPLRAGELERLDDVVGFLFLGDREPGVGRVDLVSGPA